MDRLSSTFQMENEWNKKRLLEKYMQCSTLHSAHNEHNATLLLNVLIMKYASLFSRSLSYRAWSEKEKNQVIEKNGRVFVKKKVNNNEQKNGSTWLKSSEKSWICGDLCLRWAERKKMHYIRQVPTHVQNNNKIEHIPREKKPVKILRRTTTAVQHTHSLTNMWRQAIK